MPHGGSAAKVLLVDGRAESRDMVANALTIAGFEVAAASNGASAVTLLEWESPDVIVSSAKVEDMDGYELFTLVRKHPTTLDTPFLLLAGRDRPTALAAAEAGVNIVLTGDVALDVIVARVAELSGFNSPEYFCRVFRQSLGVTPREYRQKTVDSQENVRKVWKQRR